MQDLDNSNLNEFEYNQSQNNSDLLHENYITREELHCVSQFGENTILCWEIEPYRNVWVSNTGECISSEDFETHAGVIWTIALYPIGIRSDVRQYVSLYLRLGLNSIEQQVFAKFRFVLVGPDNQERVACHAKTPLRFQSQSRENSWGFPKALKREDLLALLRPDKTAVIKCYITRCVEQRDVYRIPIRNVTQLGNDLLQLLEDGRHSDIHIKCEENQYKLHKAILAARCPYLLELIQANPDEAIGDVNAQYSVANIQNNIFNAILVFIYSGELPYNFDGDLFEVAKAARDMKISRLESICTNILESQLDVEKSLKLLVADRIEEFPKLLEKSYQSAGKKPYSIVSSPHWKTLQQSKPKAVSTLFEMIVRKSFKRKFEEIDSD